MFHEEVPLAIRVLVIDDEQWVLNMVQHALKHRGYDILTALDGEDGLAKAESMRPHLIITDVLMPKMNGWTLIKRLRAIPEFALVPVIFLTALDSAKERIHGFQLGADDYLPKPFLPEELDVRVARSLKHLMEMKAALATVANLAGQRELPGLAGSLTQIGLPSLLTMFEMERKSGILALTSNKQGETARVFLRDGSIVSARIEGQDQLQNAEAIFALLGWAEGRFQFKSLAVDLADEVQAPTRYLLMEGTRRLDELRREP